MSVRYGEIYYYDFGGNEGSVQGGFRPVLVVQNDNMNEKSPTTVVAAITSQNKRLDLKTHIELGISSGLKKPSTVMLEQIKTVNQEDLTDYIGIVESDYLLKKLRNAAKSEFGMFIYHSNNHEYVRYICPDCLDRLKKSEGILVERIKHYERSKRKCYRCPNLGYKYLIKNTKRGFEDE